MNTKRKSTKFYLHLGLFFSPLFLKRDSWWDAGGELLLLSDILNMSTMASIAVGGAEQLPNQQHVCMHSPELRRLLCTQVQGRAQLVGAADARTAS